MTDRANTNRGLDDPQAGQLPTLADRPLEEIETVAEALVEVRSISSQLTPSEVRAELTARLNRLGVHLPNADLDELVDQLAPAPE